MRAVILVLLALILPATTLRAQPRLPPIAWLSDRDGDYDVYVWDGEQTINVSNNDTNDAFIQPSPDGRIAWLGVVGDRSDVLVWDGEQTINVSNNPSYDFQPAWSNDGRLAWGSDQSDADGFSLQVAVWDGEKTVLLGREFGSSDVPNLNGGQVPIWSDSGWLAWSTLDEAGLTRIYVWDGRQIIQVMEGQTGYSPYLVWLPGGNLVWTIRYWLPDSSETNALWLWDGAQVVNVAESSPSGVEMALWGEGRLAFTAGSWEKSRVYIWTETGAVAISPDQPGRVMYLSGSDQGELSWRVEVDGMPRLYVWDGAAVHDVGRADGIFPGPVWSADGRLAWNTQTADGMHIYVWDGETISDIPPDENLYDSELMWLPDGRLAWQAGDYPAQELKFWDRGRIGTITAGVGPIRDVRVFLAGLLWTQEIDGNSDVFFWDTTQTFNVSADPGWDGLALVPAMG